MTNAPHPPKRGLFITVEGGEGAGKTTQIARLVARLRAAGVEVTPVREPGGAAGAEAVRRLLLSGDGSAFDWPPIAEALLFYAARVDVWTKAIAPALAAGRWVVADRFADSTIAYQGAAGGLGAERIAALHDLALPGVRPDVTLLLDVPAAVGLERARARGGGADAFEARGEAFHEAVRAAFRAIAAAEPARVTVVDATQPEDAVAEAMWARLAPRVSAESARGAGRSTTGSGARHG